MSITKIAVLQIGSRAYRYLTEKPRTGAVVSTFRHGFNVLFDEDSDPGFVAIQTAEVPLHPWGIVVDEAIWLLPVPIVDATARVEAHEIRFDGTWALNLEQAKVCELRITPWMQEEAARAQERIPIIREILVKELAKRIPDPFQPQIDAIIERWSETGNITTLVDLIGLGSGSTPSGDDVLVGILVSLSASSPQADRQLSRLRSTIHIEELRMNTPQPSAQMVAAALDGAFPELLCDLATQLKEANATDTRIQQCIKCVSSQGVTSGSSFLLGFISAQVNQRHQE